MKGAQGCLRPQAGMSFHFSRAPEVPLGHETVVLERQRRPDTESRNLENEGLGKVAA
jgi:hypothetical protein